jgi:cytoskeletal protein CcmA (bactofilin family)
VIGSCSTFNGTLNSTAIVRVDGVFNGEINAEEGVIIGEGGYVKGNIKSSKVTIAGKIEGNVFCSNFLELTSSGKLLGDVKVKTLNIEEGAIFQGKCTMVQQEPISNVVKDSENDNLPAISNEE